MFAGYVQKRTTPVSPPPMQRVYSVLWGTLLMDYETEEESKTSLSPRLCVEVLGVSEWDGRGRANNYMYGFLIVTHTGATYYVSVNTQQERDEWVLQLKRSLECVFANPEVVPFKPSKILSPRPEPSNNALCPATKNIINKSSAVYCRCCGLGYYAAEHVAESSTALQIGAEEAERVCLNCRNAQAVILWLKSMNYVHTMALHEGTKAVLREVRKFKASFQLRLRQSDRLRQAAQLLDQGHMTAEEFEELRQVDHSYRRELLYEEGVKLKGAVDAFGDDMQTIIDVILNSALIDKGGRWSQQAIILKVLEVADRAPDIVDFYLPQLLQAHLVIAETRTPEALVKLDLFQQALLVMAQKYPALGLKLCWGLVASVGDYAEKRCSQVQYAACVALLLQLEMVTTGYVSCIADVPTCKQLAGAMVGAMHQQQEVGCEIGALFLVRRRLQELTDDEELDRKVRRGLIDPALVDEEGNLKPGAEVAASVGPRAASAKGALIPSEASCVDLLYQLGVGQAGRGGNRFSDDDSDNADSDEEAEGGAGGDTEEGRGKSSGTAQPPSVPRYLGFQCFSEQLDFIHMLNGVVEGLRFIDRPLRSKVLLKEVTKWNAEPLRFLGWDPTCIAGEPFYRIMHIVPGECRVFRTKARAPTMLVCEVLRDDLVPVYLDIVKQRQKSLASGAIQEGPSALRLGGTAPSTGESAGADNLQLTAAIADPSVATPTHAVSRRAPNPLFVSNVDAHTIDAASRDIDVAAAERSEVLQAQEPSSARRFSADGLGTHDPLAVMAAAEAHSQLKTLHLEREKFATTSRNIEDVGNLISNMNLGSTQAIRNNGGSAEGPQLRRGEAAHQQANIAAVATIVRASTPLDDSSGNGRSGTESPGRATPAAPVLRKGGARSVLASTRLSIKNGVADLIRPPSAAAAAAATTRSTIVEDRDRESLALPSPQLGHHQHQSRLSPAGPQLQMSASGVFRPVPIPEVASSSADDAEHGSIFRDAPSEDFSQYVGDREEGSEDSFSGKPAAAGASQVTQKVLSSAQRLLADGVIDAAEYEALIASDQHFQDETAREEAVIARHKVEDAFGESWEAKKERILADKLQMFGPPSQDAWPAWDLRSFIMKSNDDLRQEVCCLQLMQLFKEIFEHFGLQQSLYLRPYRIVCTGCSTGLVQLLTDAMSLDALKKTEGFTTLAAYFQKTYDTSAERYNSARLNFASSLAAYSLFSYLLLVKDRHNGNLMIDAEGHILHIDFGFLLSIAPGGSFSLETAPFKLTEEMVEVLGGLDSPLFGEFLTAFTKGFIALQSNAENIISALQILAHNSSFPCFAGKQASVIIDKLRARFRTELSVNDAVKHCLDLITNSYGHYGTRQYDTFQWMTNGIMP